MNATMLNMQQVVKSYEGKLALDRLNFTVPQGKIVGLLGRNGAGKSTLIECALGLNTVDAGSVQLLAETPGALSESARARLGYVPQQTDLFGWMTATQTLAFFKAFYPKWNDEKVAALMQRWSIPPNVLVSKLSGGEQQRLAIIRALAHEPESLILDEPVASLDPAGRRDFLRELIDTVSDHNTTVLFSTHILTDLERVAVDVAIMKAGQIVLHTELDTLTEEAVRLVGTAAALEPLRAYWLSAAPRADSVIARVAPALQESLATAHPQVRFERVQLEDLFIEVTQ